MIQMIPAKLERAANGTIKVLVSPTAMAKLQGQNPTGKKVKNTRGTRRVGTAGMSSQMTRGSYRIRIYQDGNNYYSGHYQTRAAADKDLTYIKTLYDRSASLSVVRD